MRKILLLLLCLLIAPDARAGLIFGPDSFTVASDTNIDAYPSGSPDYTYANGATTDLLVNAASDWVIPRDNGLVSAIANITNAAVSASMGNQEVRLIVSGTAAAAAGSWVGASCKMNSGGSAGYVGILNNATTETDILEVTAGPTITTLASADRGLAEATDYSLAFRCTASAQRLIINGETAVTASDATVSSGRPGFFGEDDAAAGTAGKIDDLEVDDLSTGIWLVGVGAQAVSTTNGGSLACAYPAGYTAVANDLGVVITAGRPTDTVEVTPPTNYTQLGTSLQEIGANDLRLQSYRKLLTASEAAPTVTVPTSYSGTSAGLSCQMIVLRGVDTTTPEDATTVNSSAAAAATFTPTGITTATANAHVVAVVASADDNALRMSTFQNFTAWMGGASFDTTTGGDHAVALGSKQQVASGAVTAPTWTQMAVGNDAWAGIVMAFKVATGGGAVAPRNLALMGVGS